jgi:hypothetical protein
VIPVGASEAIDRSKEQHERRTQMRLLGHTPATSGTQTPHTVDGWARGHRTAVASAATTSTSAQRGEIERLAKANRELRAALVELIAFAGPRTAVMNESGDRIVDPRVRNAEAVLAAVEAGL